MTPSGEVAALLPKFVMHAMCMPLPARRLSSYVIAAALGGAAVLLPVVFLASQVPMPSTAVAQTQATAHTHTHGRTPTLFCLTRMLVLVPPGVPQFEVKRKDELVAAGMSGPVMAFGSKRHVTLYDIRMDKRSRISTAIAGELEVTQDGIRSITFQDHLLSYGTGECGWPLGVAG